MQEQEVNRLFKSNKKLLFISLILIVLGILSCLVYEYFWDKKDESVSESYESVIINGDKLKSHVYVDLVYIEKFAVKDDLIFCVIVDENNLLYLAEINEKMYEDISNVYNIDPENFKYRLVGYNYKLSSEVKNILINSLDELDFNYDGTVTKYNIDEYFSSTYLNVLANPNSDVFVIFALLGVVMIIVGIALFIISIVFLIRHKIFTKRIDVEKIKLDLMKPTTIAFAKNNVYLTDDYLYAVGLCDVIYYKDIEKVTQNNFKRVGLMNGGLLGGLIGNINSIEIRTNNKNKTIAMKYGNKTEELEKIVEIIKSKNNNIN